MRDHNATKSRPAQPTFISPVLPFIVRRMRPSDIPAVLKIEQRSFPTPWPESAYHYELTYRTDSKFYVLQPAEVNVSAADLTERLRQVTETPQEPILLGYMGLRFARKRSHICTIAVHPDWRGRGLGKYELLFMLEEAISHGAKQVTLEMRPSNRAAHQLYTQVGFVHTGIRYSYYRDGEDAWLMTLGPLNRSLVSELREMRLALEAGFPTKFNILSGR